MRRERENGKRSRGRERWTERRHREIVRRREIVGRSVSFIFKDVIIAGSSQIVHGQTARFSLILGYKVCRLRTVTRNNVIADERSQNLCLFSVQGGILIAPYLP